MRGTSACSQQGGTDTSAESQFIPLSAIADHSRRTYKIASSSLARSSHRNSHPRLLSRDEDRERRLSHCPARSAQLAATAPLSRGQLGGHKVYTNSLLLASRVGAYLSVCTFPCFRVSFYSILKVTTVLQSRRGYRFPGYMLPLAGRGYDKQGGYIKPHIDGILSMRKKSWKESKNTPRTTAHSSMIPSVIHSSPVAEYHHGQQPKHLDLPAISHAGAAGAVRQAAHSLRSVGVGSRAKVSTASLSVLASSSALRAGRRGSLDASAATRL